MIWWLSPAAQAGFAVHLNEHLSTKRENIVAQHQVEELVRILPPGVEPWTVQVVVPESWVGRDPRAQTPRTQLDPAQISAIAQGFESAGLPNAETTPEQIAQVLGLLQNGSFEHERPRPRGGYLVAPWALLFSPEDADTLSAALVGVAVLAELGLECGLVRYQSPSAQTPLFGVVSAGVAPLGVPWAVPLSASTVLFPMHPTAVLQSGGEQAQWTLGELMSADFDPGGSGGVQPLPAPSPKVAPVRPRPPTPQAKQESQGGLTWWLGTGLMVAAMGGLGVVVLHQRSKGARALESRRARRERERF